MEADWRVEARVRAGESVAIDAVSECLVGWWRSWVCDWRS